MAATLICAKLANAQTAAERGTCKARDNLVAAYVNEVTAQSGQALIADQAALLVRFAQALY